MTKHRIYCILGGTGTGKSTVAHTLSKAINVPVICSLTTRKPRNYVEIISGDHYFISKDEMQNLKDLGVIVAYTQIGENEYCVVKNQLITEEELLYVIDPKGVDYFLDNLHIDEHEFEIYVIYLYLDDGIRHDRLKVRGDDSEEVKKRIDAEQEQFNNFINNIETYSNKLKGLIKVNNVKLVETCDIIKNEITKWRSEDNGRN